MQPSRGEHPSDMGAPCTLLGIREALAGLTSKCGFGWHKKLVAELEKVRKKAVREAELRRQGEEEMTEGLGQERAWGRHDELPNITRHLQREGDWAALGSWARTLGFSRNREAQGSRAAAQPQAAGTVLSLPVETLRGGNMNLSNSAIECGWQVTSCRLLQLCSEPPRSCERPRIPPCIVPRTLPWVLPHIPPHACPGRRYDTAPPHPTMVVSLASKKTTEKHFP